MVTARTRNAFAMNTIMVMPAISLARRDPTASRAPIMVTAMKLQVCATVMLTMATKKTMLLFTREIAGSITVMRVRRHAPVIQRTHSLARTTVTATPLSAHAIVKKTITALRASTRFLPAPSVSMGSNALALWQVLVIRPLVVYVSAIMVSMVRTVIPGAQRGLLTTRLPSSRIRLMVSSFVLAVSMALAIPPTVTMRTLKRYSAHVARTGPAMRAKSPTMAAPWTSRIAFVTTVATARPTAHVHATRGGLEMRVTSSAHMAQISLVALVMASVRSNTSTLVIRHAN